MKIKNTFLVFLCVSPVQVFTSGKVADDSSYFQKREPVSLQLARINLTHTWKDKQTFWICQQDPDNNNTMTPIGCVEEFYKKNESGERYIDIVTKKVIADMPKNWVDSSRDVVLDAYNASKRLIGSKFLHDQIFVWGNALSLAHITFGMYRLGTYKYYMQCLSALTASCVVGTIQFYDISLVSQDQSIAVLYKFCIQLGLSSIMGLVMGFFLVESS